MTQGYLYLLLGTIMEEKLYEENAHDAIGKERLSSIKDVLDHISDHYPENITLDSLQG